MIAVTWICSDCGVSGEGDTSRDHICPDIRVLSVSFTADAITVTYEGSVWPIGRVRTELPVDPEQKCAVLAPIIADCQRRGFVKTDPADEARAALDKAQSNADTRNGDAQRSLDSLITGAEAEESVLTDLLLVRGAWVERSSIEDLEESDEPVPDVPDDIMQCQHLDIEDVDDGAGVVFSTCKNCGLQSVGAAVFVV